MRFHRDFCKLLFVLFFSSSILAAELTIEETVSYINEKLGQCFLYSLGENTSLTMAYSDLRIDVTGTNLLTHYRYKQESLVGDIYMTQDYFQTSTIDIRKLKVVEVEDFNSDGCKGYIRLGCQSSFCVNYEKKPQEGNVERSKGKFITLRFSYAEKKDLIRLNRAISH